MELELTSKIICLAFAFICTLLVIIFFIRKKSVALMGVSLGIFLLFIATYVVEWFGMPNMKLAQDIMFLICIFDCLSVIIVYENDIKSLFARVRSLHLKPEQKNLTDEEIRSSLKSIVSACQSLSKSRTGALIVVVKDKIDQYVLDSGVRLDALISVQLIESIFNTKCPMHDGAIVIKDNRILTAGSFLPLSKSLEIDKTLGTRHRAGIGVTESELNDVITIIVSEETGIISVARKGVLKRYLTPERLFDMLYDPLRENGEKYNNKK